MCIKHSAELADTKTSFIGLREEVFTLMQITDHEHSVRPPVSRRPMPLPVDYFWGHIFYCTTK